MLWKHLSAADVQEAKLDVMFLTEAVVFVSALLDALKTDRPGLGYGSRVYQLDHLTKVLTEMNKEQLLSSCSRLTATTTLSFPAGHAPCSGVSAGRL